MAITWVTGAAMLAPLAINLAKHYFSDVPDYEKRLDKAKEDFEKRVQLEAGIAGLKPYTGRQANLSGLQQQRQQMRDIESKNPKAADVLLSSLGQGLSLGANVASLGQDIFGSGGGDSGGIGYGTPISKQEKIAALTEDPYSTPHPPKQIEKASSAIKDIPTAQESYYLGDVPTSPPKPTMDLYETLGPKEKIAIQQQLIGNPYGTNLLRTPTY